MTRDEAITIMQVYKEELEHRIAKIDYDAGAIDLYSIQVDAYDMAIEALTNVQNMHKGKWIKKQVFNPELDKYVPLIECSVCGYEPYFGGSESKFNYCANCGARMKGGDDE